MESAKPEIQSLLNEGAGRLLARASDNRSLSREFLVLRITAAVHNSSGGDREVYRRYAGRRSLFDYRL